MTLDTIAVGNAPNDGTGDLLRAAFIKVNAAVVALNDTRVTLGHEDGDTSVGAYVEPDSSDWVDTDDVLLSLARLRKAVDEAIVGGGGGASNIVTQDNALRQAINLGADADWLLRVATGLYFGLWNAGNEFAETLPSQADTGTRSWSLWIEYLSPTEGYVVATSTYAEFNEPSRARRFMATLTKNSGDAEWNAPTEWFGLSISGTVELIAPAGQTLDLSVTNARELQVGNPADEIVIRPPQPAVEGRQHATLWALSRYGSADEIYVRSLGNPAIAHTAHSYVASSSIPRYTFEDACQIRLTAQGEYLAGSADPRLNFGVAIGPDIPRPLAIFPEGGFIRGFNNPLTAIGDAGGIEVSWRTLGENALGHELDQALHWRIDATVEFLPEGGLDRFSSSGIADGNVRVSGTVKISRPTLMRGAFGTHPGPNFQTETDTWYPDRVGGFPAGYPVSAHGRGYVSIWDQARSGALTEERLDFIERRAPGSGQRWREHWYAVNQEIPFEYCSTADLVGDDMTFSLVMGGPLAMDLGVTAPAWVNTGATFYDSSLYRTDPANPNYPVVSHAGSTWVARFVHARTSSLEPGTGGESERYWRQLSNDRRDIMKVYSTFATITGGRVGVSDFIQQ